jgi:transposase-like protein
MPRSLKLRDVNLTFGCPHCGHPLTMKGGSLMTVSGFTCVGCQVRVPLTYDEKLRLFAKNAHLA